MDRTERTKSTETVSRVIDGDTFETRGGNPPVRLLNVRAPEMHHPLGPSTRDSLAWLLRDGTVHMEVEPHLDKHGRRLAWVTCGNRCVNDAMNDLLAEHGPD